METTKNILPEELTFVSIKTKLMIGYLIPKNGNFDAEQAIVDENHNVFVSIFSLVADLWKS